MVCTTRSSKRSTLVARLLCGARLGVGVVMVSLLACAKPAKTAESPVIPAPRPAPPVAPPPTVSAPPPRVAVPAPVDAPAPKLPDTSCHPLASIGRGGDSLSVIATTAIDQTQIHSDPTAAHRFAFGRAYEGLVSVDCTGAIFPGVARSWSQIDSAKTRFVLRSDARFWTGHVVRAGDVVGGWSAFDDSLARAFAESSMVVNDSTLDIRVDPRDIKLLASTHLRVIMPLANQRWPLGTGTHRIAEGEGVRLEPIDPARGTLLTIRSTSLAGARNAIDAGADIVLTGDSATAAYAARRIAGTTTPLEWDRTWSLAILQTFTASVLAEDTARWNGVRNDLAFDVLRSSARPSAAPPWTLDPNPACPIPPHPTTRARISYLSDDLVARAIAERLVALALPGMNATARVIAAPLSAGVFADAFTFGADAGLVVSTPFHAQPCMARNLIPLVDTRWQAVVRPNARRSPSP